MKHNSKEATKLVASSSELRNNAFIGADVSNSNGHEVRFKKTIVSPPVERSTRSHRHDLTEDDLTSLTTMVSMLQIDGVARMPTAKGPSTATTTTASANVGAISSAPTPQLPMGATGP